MDCLISNSGVKISVDNEIRVRIVVCEFWQYAVS
jgi:hypothetical protein